MDPTVLVVEGKGERREREQNGRETYSTMDGAGSRPAEGGSGASEFAKRERCLPAFDGHVPDGIPPHIPASIAHKLRNGDLHLLVDGR